MKNTTLLLLTVLAWVCTPARADADADRLVLQNEQVRRVLERDGQVWRTTSLSRADGSDAVRIESDEFLIRMLDGVEWTVADYRCVARPAVEMDPDGQHLSISYLPTDAARQRTAPAVLINYQLGAGPYLRKVVHLTWPTPQAVDRLEVERFRTTEACAQGGRGEPVFIGSSWFCGLEYPGSEAGYDEGVVRLAHFPGLAKWRSEDDVYLIRSKTAVAGVGQPGDPIEMAFADYLETIRRPSRVLLHYNSWYDFRGNELTPDNLVKTFAAFKKNVLDPYGLTMDVFVPDDGWQNSESIWVPRQNLYPEGFGPLAKQLEANGTRLGLWIPFNGFNLDAAWGAARGYEKADQGRFYCLAGANYDAEIRRVLKRLITEGHIGYFKHDFNQLQCSAPGHGHLPDERHGHEANLDAELELLAFERQLQPDIHQNVTSYVWHSPWWLMHADTIWMAAGDFGYNTDWPQLSPREWAMSYRDAHFHKLYKERNTLVPLSAMMTHGLIHGRYQKLGGDEETLREWSDYVVMYYGRGVQLMEWYLTPEMMSPQRWEILGQATRWAVDNREVLEKVVRVGGDPRRGEAYGYAHWNGDRGILVVRNPDTFRRPLEVPFDKSVLYRGTAGRTFYGRVIYPYVEQMAETFESGQTMRVNVPGCSVMVYELSPQPLPGPEAIDEPSPPDTGGRMLRGRDGLAKIRTNVTVPDEDLQRCDLYFVLRSTARVVPPAVITVDGQAVSSRHANGSDWHLHSVDLRPQRGRSIEVLLTFADESAVFSQPPIEASAWLLMDREVEPAGAVDSQGLPPAISHRHRRQAIPLLPELRLAGRSSRRAVAAEELPGIQAGKLRICVFDSNAEEAYRDKFIMLNGQELGRVPANTGPLSVWQQHVLDVPPELLAGLQRTSEIVITNPGGDYFKVAGLALAVQLADGTWAETQSDQGVYSSTERWQHAEGVPFADGRSGVIKLSFE